MTILSEQSCSVCNSGTPKIEGAEASQLLVEIPLWKISSEENLDKLSRCFSFDNFQAAISFTNQIGELAEQENHHPALLTEWGKVTVSWWTHTIGGLHKNDFIMASRSDLLYLCFEARSSHSPLTGNS
mgnify:CR=1 FL=1|jgi:4a-hydroxytetrahydrobiopterin dehydratase